MGKVIFTYEESYGYMLGDYVRDKDAVTASLMLTEMAAWYAAAGHDPGRRPGGPVPEVRLLRRKDPQSGHAGSGRISEKMAAPDEVPAGRTPPPTSPG